MGPFLLRGEEGCPSRSLYGERGGFSRLAEGMSALGGGFALYEMDGGVERGVQGGRAMGTG